MDKGIPMVKKNSELPFYRRITFKFWIIAIFSAVPLVIATYVIMTVAWSAVSEEGRFYLFVAGAFAWFIEAGAITYLYRMWVHPVKTLSRGIEVIHLSNPLHEIDIYTGDEMEQAARQVQAIGRMVQETYSRLDALIEAEMSPMKRESVHLSQVLDSIGAGVVVVNLDGLITLCNREADFWIDEKVSVLGRSIFHYFDREILASAMDEVNPDLHSAKALAKVDIDSESVSAVYVSPYFESENFSGYILTIWRPHHHMESKGDEWNSREQRPEFYDFGLLESASVSDVSLLETPLDELTIIAFDTETTGLQPSKGDKIISIGALRIRNGKIREGEIYETLVDPQMEIPEYSIQFHNISDDMVKGKPRLSEVLPDFISFCDGAVLLGHNVAFDIKFIDIQLESEGKQNLDHPVLDTLLLSYVLHDHYEDHNLKSLAERLGIKVVGLHTAVGDAMMTAEVFLRLLPLLKNRGVNTVAEAVRFSKKAFGIRKEQGKF